MIKAVIIEDEKNSREILEWQLNKHCPQVKVLSFFGSSAEAVEQIHRIAPQLVFLDIQMPEINGFEFLQKVNPIDFEVVFTTAHNEYAVKAFKYSAIDYLLKPVDAVELRAAVEKVEHKINSRLPALPSPKRMALTTTNSLIFIDPEDILFCEGQSNYTNFHLRANNKKILVSRTLKEIEEMLIPYNFFRIHNSFVINMKHVKEYVRGAGGYVIMANDAHLTVSRGRKDDFFASFNKF
jgi:two-component system LytT family response regulator